MLKTLIDIVEPRLPEVYTLCNVNNLDVEYSEYADYVNVTLAGWVGYDGRHSSNINVSIREFDEDRFVKFVDKFVVELITFDEQYVVENR